ncbi:peptidylprolyl isomerase [Glaciimonas immobilis]|uniref:Peptidyl-prolyl cis-trans isomerase n=1 Tax=Glaciimonas immobilis TaxID=728004 RepID=A0A840RNH1_9BURK|nr:peptidylprolyl isomerase [Glaciimonas immobilis]KAF3998887.1 peptidyl-prolyl cis-trans isomerase [Glaciimonas immobilis]MBB5198284.1 peptidyl-prolyl cis-trans isomerase A (cyclophilin A)/peptidyl-prolyl cis-trans isomerase B (cyclophilin B) [Glaciimonas immobilis]
MQSSKHGKPPGATSISRRSFSRALVSSVAAISLTFAFSTAHAADMPHVMLKTNMGDIVLELNAEKAPKTVKNFLSYVNTGHYNGTIFHRVIDGFMIQGGGFDKKMNEKAAPNKVENEGKNGLKNAQYTVAMARTSDPQSAGAQFFINTNDNQFLNYPGQDGYGYAVFGKVIQGMDVVDKIKKVKTGAQDVPVQQVVIESATITK